MFMLMTVIPTAAGPQICGRDIVEGLCAEALLRTYISNRYYGPEGSFWLNSNKDWSFDPATGQVTCKLTLNNDVLLVTAAPIG